jgi:hypothetical protein
MTVERIGRLRKTRKEAMDWASEEGKVRNVKTLMLFTHKKGGTVWI